MLRAGACAPAPQKRACARREPEMAAAPKPTDDLAEARAGYALALPAMAILFIVLLGPSLAVVALALTDWQLGAPSMNFIGLGNFEQLFADRVFWRSLGNTVIYCLVTVPESVFLGL